MGILDLKSVFNWEDFKIFLPYVNYQIVQIKDKFKKGISYEESYKKEGKKTWM